MASIILVAGAWHGGWCWNATATFLRDAGHEVFTPDLPGMAPDVRTYANLTLDVWAECIADVVLRAKDKPFVLGHSRGGIVISQTAELVPDKIAELVYLSAALLPNGTVPISGLIERMAGQDQVTDLPDQLLPSPFEEVRHKAFNDCSEQIARAAYSQLVPEPVAPLTQPLRLSDERFGGVPRTYIECHNDNAVSLEAQRAMQALLPCGRHFELSSGHSPFLSMPRALADVLIEIVTHPLRRG